MTLVEFLEPVKNRTLRDICISVLYFEEKYSNRTRLTIDEIRKALIRARVRGAPKTNIADILTKAGSLVDFHQDGKASRNWFLTETGRRKVRELHGFPESEVEIEEDTATLEGLATKLKDPDLKKYVEEGIKCLRVGALKASVVFLWAGAARLIQQECMKQNVNDVNAAILKHQPNAKTIRKIEDFAYINDKTLLLAAQDLGIFDKAEKGTLEDALNLRNRCGHPAKYHPGPKRVSSFIEDLVGVVFT